MTLRSYYIIYTTPVTKTTKIYIPVRSDKALQVYGDKFAGYMIKLRSIVQNSYKEHFNDEDSLQI